MAFAQNKTFISLQLDCLSSSLLILGDFRVKRCVLADIITSSSVLQLRLLQTRSSALSLESKYQQLYQTKNCATIQKIKLKQYCRCHLPPSNISIQNSRNKIIIHHLDGLLGPNILTSSGPQTLKTGKVSLKSVRQHVARLPGALMDTLLIHQQLNKRGLHLSEQLKH